MPTTTADRGSTYADRAGMYVPADKLPTYNYTQAYICTLSAKEHTSDFALTGANSQAGTPCACPFVTCDHRTVVSTQFIDLRSLLNWQTGDQAHQRIHLSSKHFCHHDITDIIILLIVFASAIAYYQFVRSRL